ncbi:MAG: MmcQ/YjbR family DNA-binding protein [Rhizomicrobium sp.]
MNKKAAAKPGVTPAQFKKVALSFPGTHEKPSYGSPAVFAARKFFTRLRKEDNSVVLIVHDMEHRDMMLELDPKTYHITAHYKDYPAILVRMERITADELRIMLERRWRQIAPKWMVRQRDENFSPAERAGMVTRAKRVTAGTKKKKK